MTLDRIMLFFLFGIRNMSPTRQVKRTNTSPTGHVKTTNMSHPVQKITTNISPTEIDKTTTNPFYCMFQQNLWYLHSTETLCFKIKAFYYHRREIRVSYVLKKIQNFMKNIIKLHQDHYRMKR